MFFKKEKEILKALAIASNFVLTCSKAKIGERIVFIDEGTPKTFTRED